MISHLAPHGPLHKLAGMVCLLFVVACSGDAEPDLEDLGDASSELPLPVNTSSPGESPLVAADTPGGGRKATALNSADYVHRAGDDPEVLLELVEDGVWMVLAVDETNADDVSVLQMALATAESLRGAVRVAVDVGGTAVKSMGLESDFPAFGDRRCSPQWQLYQDGIDVGSGCGHTTQPRIRRAMVSALAYDVGDDRDLLKAGMSRIGPRNQPATATDDEGQGRFRFFISGKSDDFKLIFRDAPMGVVPFSNKPPDSEGAHTHGTWLILFVGVWTLDQFVYVLDVADDFGRLDSDATLGIGVFNEWEEIAEWFPDFKDLPAYEPLWVALRDGETIDTQIGFLDAQDLRILLAKVRRNALPSDEEQGK